MPSDNAQQISCVCFANRMFLTQIFASWSRQYFHCTTAEFFFPRSRSRFPFHYSSNTWYLSGESVRNWKHKCDKCWLRNPKHISNESARVRKIQSVITQFFFMFDCMKILLTFRKSHVHGERKSFFFEFTSRKIFPSEKIYVDIQFFFTSQRLTKNKEIFLRE